MALINCPDCQASISDLAPACPKCGRPVVAVVEPPAIPATTSAGVSGLGRVLDEAKIAGFQELVAKRTSLEELLTRVGSLRRSARIRRALSVLLFSLFGIGAVFLLIGFVEAFARGRVGSSFTVFTAVYLGIAFVLFCLPGRSLHRSAIRLRADLAGSVERITALANEIDNLASRHSTILPNIGVNRVGTPLSGWASGMLKLDTGLLVLQSIFLVIGLAYGVRTLSEPLSVFAIAMITFGVLGNTGLLRGEPRGFIPAIVGFALSLPVQFLLRLPLIQNPAGVHPDSWVAHHRTDMVVLIVAWSIVYDFVYFQSITTIRRSSLNEQGWAAISIAAGEFTSPKPTLKQLGLRVALTGIGMFIVAVMIMLSFGYRLEGFLLGGVNGCILGGPVFAIVGVVMFILGSVKNPKKALGAGPG